MARQTVMDLLPKIPNLRPAGRLDKETEGLLIISNDGEFINILTHPRYECSKQYWVELERQIDPAEIRKIESGVKIDGKKTAPSKIKIHESRPKHTALTIEIHEGRNRQIRKMFASIDAPVKYLKRLSIGPIKLGDLKKGSYRELSIKELDACKPS